MIPNQALKEAWEEWEKAQRRLVQVQDSLRPSYESGRLTPEPAEEGMILWRRERWLALINALVAVLMTLGIPLWPYYVAHAAADYEDRHGLQGDAPMMLLFGAWFFTLTFFAPSAALLTAASVSMWERGRHRKLLQVLAILSLIVPVILVVRFAVMFR